MGLASEIKNLSKEVLSSFKIFLKKLLHTLKTSLKRRSHSDTGYKKD